MIEKLIKYFAFIIRLGWFLYMPIVYDYGRFDPNIICNLLVFFLLRESTVLFIIYNMSNT